VLIPGPSDAPVQRARIEVFLNALEPLGWRVGTNLQLDTRLATHETDLRRQTTELVAGAPDIILASTNQALASTRQATHTIPIVFVLTIDPVGDGNVASRARPGSKGTGFSLSTSSSI
jgi:ABC-type uncharacterized transport system substrate-binding protein